MTKRRRTPTDTPPSGTEWDAADAEWKAEHAKGTEPESLPLPFDDSEDKTAEQPRYVSHESDELQAAVRESERSVLERYGAAEEPFEGSYAGALKLSDVVTVQSSIGPLEVEQVPNDAPMTHSDAVAAATIVGDTVLERAVAVIDEYVSRCTSGESLSLGELREMRSRVAAL